MIKQDIILILNVEKTENGILRPVNYFFLQDIV